MWAVGRREWVGVGMGELRVAGEISGSFRGKQ